MSSDKTSEKKNDNISYIKGIYVWKTSINEFYNQRIKIIKTINNNIKLPLINIYENNNEFILKPRCVVNYQFSNENAMLIWCDIFDLEGNCYSCDNRIGFLKVIQEYNKIIEKKSPKISFIQKYEIEQEDLLKLDSEFFLNELIKLCLGSGIEIDEYQLCNNTLELQNNPSGILAACDELLVVRYLFYKLSLKYRFNYKLSEQLKYKFYDINTTSDKGYESVIKYVTKLGNIHPNINKLQLCKDFKDINFSFGKNTSNMIMIPETVKKFNNGFFIDQRFNVSSDHYSIIFSNIKFLYENEEIKESELSLAQEGHSENI